MCKQEYASAYTNTRARAPPTDCKAKHWDDGDCNTIVKDCEALTQLFKLTSGSQWHRSSGWTDVVAPPYYCCEREGVVCNFDNSSVIKVSLPNNNLQVHI